MAFLRARPSLGLQPYIVSYWAYQGQAGSLLEDYTYPDGCPEIIFNIETDVLKVDADGLSKNPDIEVIGQLTQPYQVRAQGSQIYFGVRFYPHGLSAFNPVSVNELNNQNIDACDVFTGDIQRLLNHCQSLDNFQQFVQQANYYFERLAIDSMSKRESSSLVKACIQTLLTTPHELSIADLCEHYSVSSRWLQLKFKNYVGISPKTLQKTLRFHSGLQILSRNTLPLTSVSAECGYYDQAHFNREFKSLSGITPTIYQKRTHPINQHFLEGDQGHNIF